MISILWRPSGISTSAAPPPASSRRASLQYTCDRSRLRTDCRHAIRANLTLLRSYRHKPRGLRELAPATLISPVVRAGTLWNLFGPCDNSYQCGKVAKCLELRRPAKFTQRPKSSGRSSTTTVTIVGDTILFVSDRFEPRYKVIASLARQWWIGKSARSRSRGVRPAPASPALIYLAKIASRERPDGRRSHRT